MTDVVASPYERYGVTELTLPPGFEELVKHVPGRLLTKDMSPDRRKAMARLVVEGVAVGLGLAQSGVVPDTVQRAQVAAHITQGLFEAGFRSWSTDESEFIAGAMDLGREWQSSGIFPIRLSTELERLGSDPAGTEW